MEPYMNLSGQSNVSHYQIGEDFINVKFKDKNKGDGCDTYKYSYSHTGQSNIEHMKGLARSGRGLNSFISSEVKKNYERKWSS